MGLWGWTSARIYVFVEYYRWEFPLDYISYSITSHMAKQRTHIIIIIIIISIIIISIIIISITTGTSTIIYLFIYYTNVIESVTV